MMFWYRQSPRPLFAQKAAGRVSWSDPSLQLSGMAAVRYDLTGRLVALSVVPPQVEAQAGAAPSTAPDWGPLLEAARLDSAKLRPVEPRWTPPFHADARAAWEGRGPGVPRSRSASRPRPTGAGRSGWRSSTRGRGPTVRSPSARPRGSGWP